MKSNKWILGLMTVVLVLALAPSGFAQSNIPAIQLSILNSPSALEIAGNRNAQVTDPNSFGSGLTLSASVFATNTSISTINLVLTFPGPITAGNSSGAFQGGTGNNSAGTVIAVPNSTDNIRISGATGVLATASLSSINYNAGTITIALPGSNLPGAGVTAGGSGSLNILGVRMDLTGAVTGSNRALTSAVLTVQGTLASGASTTTGWVAPASMPTLISSIQPGAATGIIGSTSTSNGVVTMFTSQTTNSFADSSASVLFTEPFVSAWRTATQSSTGGTAPANGTQLNVSIAGLPAGVTASFVQQSGTQATITPTTFTLSTVTTSQIVTMTVTDLTILDKIGFDVTLGGQPTSALTAGNITVTAVLTPTVGIANAATGLTTTGATAPNTAGIPTVTGGYPRFDAAGNSTTVTLGSIIPLQTTMLIPYALKVSPYESAFDIANTSLDPFSVGSASPTAGAIQFWLFPNNTSANGIGTMVTVTTNSTNATTSGQFLGSGLSANGTLAAGANFGTTMTSLMNAAGMTGNFVGYIFIQTAFPNAHGIGYLFTNGNLSSATDVDVLPTPSITSRSTATGSAESLGF